MQFRDVRTRTGLNPLCPCDEDRVSARSERSQMINQTIQKRTACLLLVLMGLVGGLGTGLHNVFDCCHDCGCETDCGSCELVDSNPSHCGCAHCPSHAAGTERPIQIDAGKRGPISPAANSHDHCAICQLLSTFQTTATSPLWQQFVYANRGAFSIAIPISPQGSSLRLEPSRGPPTCVNSIFAV